jgi:peptidyl-Lys metalloendopeptidase
MHLGKEVRTMQRLLSCLSALIACLTFSVAEGAPPQELEGLSASLSMPDTEIAASEAVKVAFTLTNGSNQAVNVLRWRTPLEGFNSDMFMVQQEGEPVPYLGRVVKRGRPSPEDYVTIPAGQSISVNVDLESAYAIYQAADYTVSLRTELLDLGAAPSGTLAQKTTFVPRPVESNTISFTLVEAKGPPPAAPAAAAPTPSEVVSDIVAPKTPAFKNCSSGQQSILKDALTESARYAALSVLLLEGVTPAKRASCKRYRTWFGAFTETRWDREKGNFTKIYAALANETITFNCDCDESYYAYVYPNRPYEIWLCNAFWPAPLTGEDSKAGTVVHETSHFNVVADTDDIAYGQASCKNLANANPDQAVANADSHEYFAENDPSLSCGLEHITPALLVFLASLTWLGRGRAF